jgi:hypothetical protein
MRLHRSTVAVAATVLTLASGGGAAWACTGGQGDPGSRTTTGTTTTGSTTTGTTAATTTAAVRHATRHAQRTRRHSRRHAQRS